MQNKYLAWTLFILLLLILFAASALLSLSSGEAAIGLKDIPSVLGDKEQMEYYILTQIRMPESFWRWQLADR